MEYATYNQLKYLKKCFVALRHKNYQDDFSIAHDLGLKLPLKDNSREKASKGIKAAHYKLCGYTNGSVSEYWEAVRRECK